MTDVPPIRDQQIATREELGALLNAVGEHAEAAIVRDPSGRPWLIAEDDGDYWATSHSREGDDGIAQVLAAGLDLPLSVVCYPEAIPGQNSDKLQRFKPHRDTLALTIARSKGHAGVVTVKDYRCADAILALFAAQPTVAEVRAQTLREAAAVSRLDRVGGLTWIARAVEAWLNARAGHIAAAGHEAEGGAR